MGPVEAVFIFVGYLVFVFGTVVAVGAGVTVAMKIHDRFRR